MLVANGRGWNGVRWRQIHAESLDRLPRYRHRLCRPCGLSGVVRLSVLEPALLASGVRFGEDRRGGRRVHRPYCPQINIGETDEDWRFHQELPGLAGAGSVPQVPRDRARRSRSDRAAGRTHRADRRGRAASAGCQSGPGGGSRDPAVDHGHYRSGARDRSRSGSRR